MYRRMNPVQVMVHLLADFISLVLLIVDRPGDSLIKPH